MKCEACEFYQGDNHCWVNHKAIDPCPEAVCDKFKFERVVGEHVAEERARIIALIEARQADIEEALSKVKYQQYHGRIYDEGQLEGKRDMCELLIAELRGEG